MNEIYYPSHDGKTTIHACIWRPEGEIKGVVQIIHGMCEHVGRYSKFAEYLNGQGYIVCAEDHLGHGKSVLEEKRLGYFSRQRSTKIVIDDIRALHLAVKKQTEGKPYFLLGHSMGSFFCRKYISLYGSELSGALILGTGFKDAFTLCCGLVLTRLNALVCGWHHRSKILTKIAFASYNKKFKPVNSDFDWLSKDEENVAAYNADPLCGFTFTDNGYHILFSILKDVCSHKTIEATPKDLPVILLSGLDDPVGSYGNGVLKLKKKFEEAEMKDVEVKLYDGARHEILNDFCREEVYGDILAFIEKCSGGSNG